jgi:hypothetical protein
VVTNILKTLLPPLSGHTLDRKFLLQYIYVFPLQALDGFIMVFSSSGRIFYASESITSILGHLPVSMFLITEHFSTTL